ncbi:MAG: hypothetical protein RL748_2809 [Pseudomonadota bacterium]|jgi:hypothetical protein
MNPSFTHLRARTSRTKKTCTSKIASFAWLNWALLACTSAAAQCLVVQTPLPYYANANLAQQSNALVLAPGQVVQACEKTNSGQQCVTLMMPTIDEGVLRIASLPDLETGDVSWLAFSKNRINLCAARPASHTVLCQQMPMENLPEGQIQVRYYPDKVAYLEYYQMAASQRSTAQRQLDLNQLGIAVMTGRSLLTDVLRQADPSKASDYANLCISGRDASGEWALGVCGVTEDFSFFGSLLNLVR